jgi:hypothetical protein
MKSVLPDYVRVLLWDTNPDKVDLLKHADYIIEKIFLLGDLEATKWAIQN